MPADSGALLRIQRAEEIWRGEICSICARTIPSIIMTNRASCAVDEGNFAAVIDSSSRSQGADEKRMPHSPARIATHELKSLWSSVPRWAASRTEGAMKMRRCPNGSQIPFTCGATVRSTPISLRVVRGDARKDRDEGAWSVRSSPVVINWSVIWEMIWTAARRSTISTGAEATCSAASGRLDKPASRGLVREIALRSLPTVAAAAEWLTVGPARVALDMRRPKRCHCAVRFMVSSYRPGGALAKRCGMCAGCMQFSDEARRQNY